MSDRGDEQVPADAGFSLVELLVTMLVGSIALIMVGTFFVNVANLTTAGKADRNALAQSALAFNAVRTVVTMASDNAVSDTASTQAVVAATGTSLTVTSYANTVASAIAPSQVTFALDGSGYLSQSTTAGVAAPSGYWAFTGATTTRRIAGPFITASGTPFFSYVDAAGSVLTLGTSGLAATDLRKVAFVRLTAKSASRTVGGAADPVVVTSSVGLTNVYRDVDASVVLPGLSGGQ